LDSRTEFAFQLQPFVNATRASSVPLVSDPDAVPGPQDTGLLPDEDSDLEQEIARTIGEEWLHEKNIWLKGATPHELIGTPLEFKVRDLVRSAVVAALS
jgi:hypothetical protein